MLDTSQLNYYKKREATVLLLDPTFVLLIPALILAVYAQFKVRSTYQRFEKTGAASGLTGAEAARKILRYKAIDNVGVEEVEGNLTDHYDPRTKVVSLSSGVYNGTSLAALGVAAHETGHAMQDAKEYTPLKLRTTFFPVASIGSTAAFPLFFIGLLFRFPALMDLGIIFFTAAVVFQVITLPVEFNATNRALALLTDSGVFVPTEVPSARKVLRAAGLTYVAAAAMSLLQLLRLVLLRQSRD